jgi:hypothetical protein
MKVIMGKNIKKYAVQDKRTGLRCTLIGVSRKTEEFALIKFYRNYERK